MESDYRELELDELETSLITSPKPETLPDNNLITPRFYGVPHDTWRPNQKDALLFLRGMIDNGDKRPFFMELPTGSGKSSIPTALGHTNQVMVLVNSLALLDQYRDRYGFKIVKGMREYHCVFPPAIEFWKAKYNKVPSVADCKFEKMSDCPVVHNCPYLLARAEAFAADRMACTYPFAMLSRPAQLRSGMLFMDEGHMAAETILDLSELRFTEKFRWEFSLPAIPLLGYEGILEMPQRVTLSNWFKQCMSILKSPPSGIFLEDESKWRSAYNKVYYAHVAILDRSQEFFLRAKKDLETEKYTLFGKVTDRPVAGLAIKYMSAALLAGKLTKHKTRTIVMSATIGNPAPLASELGMSVFATKAYGHPVPVEKRPVFDIMFERLTWDNMQKMPALQRMQAIQIAKFIRTLDPDWRGLILTSSHAKAGEIRKYLETTEMGSRLYHPPAGQEGLNQRINAFMYDDRKGLIVVDPMQGWGHGLDLKEDLARFVIVASVPFGNHQDPYEKARKKFGGAEYAWWKSYMHVPQACGRVTRGETYADGTYWYNVGMLADGSATTGSALRYYPSWFTEAITPLYL